MTWVYIPRISDDLMPPKKSRLRKIRTVTAILFTIFANIKSIEPSMKTKGFSLFYEVQYNFYT